METNDQLQQIQVRIATPDDEPNIIKLMNEVARETNYEHVDYLTPTLEILRDVNYGFIVYSYTENQDKSVITPSGLMIFTYEWSDWRNGLFFWLQAVHVSLVHRELGFLSQMCDFLQDYMKERGCVGIRLSKEARCRDFWMPVVKKLGMTSSHYHIYKVDVSSKDEAVN